MRNCEVASMRLLRFARNDILVSTCDDALLISSCDDLPLVSLRGSVTTEAIS